MGKGVKKVLKTVLKYILNRRSISDPKPINLKTLKYFVQGHLREMGKNFGIVDQHILEQASWREKQVRVKSPECLKEGMCIHCECSINETLLSDPECKHGCFPVMLKPNEWEVFKEQNNITFDADNS